jgi:uncharacterized protein YjiK
MKSSRASYAILAMTTPVMAVEPLHDYTHLETHYIPAVSEASGIGYNGDTDTLFAIGDEGEALVQLTKTGVAIDSMAFDFDVSPRELRGLDDPEGVAYLGNNTFMLADERDFFGRITTYEAGARRTQADLEPSSYSFGAVDGNNGLEGIACDPAEKAVWGIKELGPTSIYRMTGLPQLNGGTGGSVTVTEPIERRYITRLDTNYGVNQLSDIYALSACPAFPPGHPRHLNLLLLSRNSKLILEITRKGAVIDTLSFAAIGRSTVEGITMDSQGVLYLCSEGSATAEAGSPLSFSGLHVLSPPAPPLAMTGCVLSEEGETMTASVTWNSVAGKNYVVEYNDDLLDDWEIVSSTISASSATSSAQTNPVPRSDKGFFRVRELDP